MGAALPSAASALGAGASGLGMNSAGNFLSNYGAQNAILPSLGLGSGGVSGGSSGAASGGSSLGNMITGSGGTTASAGSQAVGEAAKEAAKKGWFDKMTEPKNLLTTAALAGSFMNRPKEKKEKSPEQIASEEKRYRNASRLSKAEIEADEAAEFLKKQANYRLRHNLAGGESLAASPVYRKVNTPEEYRKNNRWLEYYNNPEMTGNPLLMKMGGKVPNGYAPGGEVNNLDPRNSKMNNTHELSYEWPNLKGSVLNDINTQKGINNGLESKYGTELQNSGNQYKQNYDKLDTENHQLGQTIRDYAQNNGLKSTLLGMKKGGSILPKLMIEEEEIEYPSGKGVYFKGHTGGQDDKRTTKLPEGSYIVDASTVSDIGDGNSEAGKRHLDALVSDGEYYIPPKAVSNMGKGNTDIGAKKLDEMIKNIRQHKRGGKVNLPPKAKSLASYMVR